MSCEGVQHQFSSNCEGRFDEVPDCVRAVEAGVGRFANEIVDAVAEFVEECDYFVVFEETWFLRGWLREVADERCGRVSAGAVLVGEAWLQIEVRCVTVFAVSWGGDRDRGSRQSHCLRCHRSIRRRLAHPGAKRCLRPFSSR